MKDRYIYDAILFMMFDKEENLVDAATVNDKSTEIRIRDHIIINDKKYEITGFEMVEALEMNIMVISGQEVEPDGVQS